MRVTNAPASRKRRARTIRAAKGFRMRRSKLYRYRIWNGPRRSPLRAARSWWVKPALDPEAMARAGVHLLGTHDFASFQAVGS